MRFPLTGALLIPLAFAASRSILAEEDDDGDDGQPSVVRPAHDVSCDLRLLASAAVAPGTSVPAKLVVRNRGRRREPVVTLSVFADSVTGTPLWTGTTSLRGRGRRTKRVSLFVPEGTTSLVAVATCDEDANPGNDIDVEYVGDPASAPPANAYAVAGAASYATNCASCHGTDARGTTLAPTILHRSASDVLEAMREGEEGMPRFPEMTWQDARNLAAWLADPSAATLPPPPTTEPPPPGTTPTYTAQVKPLLDVSCVVCHTGANAPKSIRLDTYATASTNAAKALAAMQGGTMPPGNPLPAASVQLVADWIAGGKPK